MGAERDASPPSKPASPQLIKATVEMVDGVVAGKSVDDAATAALTGGEGELNEVQAQYKDKVRERLVAQAEELSRRARAGEEKAAFAQKLFERSRYKEAIALIDEAVGLLPTDSKEAGMALVWKAMAFERIGREDLTRALYAELEGHPVKAVRAQAGDLLFILDAPKMAIAEDERVKVPDLSNKLDKAKDSWGGARKPRPMKKKTVRTWEDDLEEYEFRGYTPNRWAVAAWAAVCVYVAWYSSQVGS